MIWRDIWGATPGVVIVSERGLKGGELDATLLALRLPKLPPTLSVTNERGEALTLRTPAGLDPFSINIRITLSAVEAKRDV